jgi:fatty acid desaturase
LQLLERCSRAEGVRLFIGEESGFAALGSYSLVTAPYGVGGRVLGVLTLTPYDFWRHTHAVHHASSGNLARRGMGDIDTLTVREYLALPWWGRLRYRLYRHPVVMFGLGPTYMFILQHRLPVGLMRDGWRPWLAGAIAPLGFLGYIAWVGHRLGRADGYFHVQNDAWKMSYDLGQYTIRTAHGLLTKASALQPYVVSLVLLAAVALLIILATDRLPWQMTAYAAVILAMSLFGDGYYHSKARLLIPAFPLLIPVAAALAKARRPVTVVVLGLLTVMSAGYGVYLSMVWTHSP